jgi:hypothetical protein
LAFAAAVVTYELHVEDKTALDYDRDRIPKYNYVRGYTATLSELGTFVEKEFKFNKGVNTNFDLWDHFGNVKFSNWRPIYDYSEFTFEDVINKSIGTQIGCKVEISGI